MGIIYFNIDNQRKDKIKKIMKEKGIEDINEFIIKAIDNEIELQNNLSEWDAQANEIEFSKKDNEIIKKLSKISSQLKKISNYDEKIELIVELDDYIRDNKDAIKEKFPDLLVSILNSL